jgi:hypothetical protein
MTLVEENIADQVAERKNTLTLLVLLEEALGISA